MKFLNRSITAFVIVMLMAALVPAAVPAYAGEVVEEDAEYEEYIEPTEEEYVICDDSPLEGDDLAGVQTVTDFILKFERLTAKSARADVEAKSTTKSITSKVQMQKYVSSKSGYVNVKGVSSTKTASTYTIKHSPKFSVSSGGSYRVKVVVTSGSSKMTKYKKLS